MWHLSQSHLCFGATTSPSKFVTLHVKTWGKEFWNSTLREDCMLNFTWIFLRRTPLRTKEVGHLRLWESELRFEMYLLSFLAHDLHFTHLGPALFLFCRWRCNFALQARGQWLLAGLHPKCSHFLLTSCRSWTDSPHPLNFSWKSVNIKAVPGALLCIFPSSNSGC